MSKRTLESLARRLEEHERLMSEQSPALNPAAKDGRSVVEISDDNAFTRLMLTKIDADQDADRGAALSGETS